MRKLISMKGNGNGWGLIGVSKGGAFGLVLSRALDM